MKTGGAGLTLVEAAVMVCVDGLSQANPAERQQVMKRIHRIGQTKDVCIYDLCIQNSIDEVMLNMVYPSKQALSTNLLAKQTVALPTSKRVSIGFECERLWGSVTGA